MDKPLPFDRVLGFEELLPRRQRERLVAVLGALVGGEVFVRPLGGEPPGEASVPLTWELEPVGWLEAPGCEPARLPAMARLVQLMMEYSAGYQMASALHLATVLGDYETLQQKHAELQASEQRYRELAEKLEQEVKRQVAWVRDREAKLFQTARQVAVGQMAAGIAHEVNNPLGFIRSNLETARSYLDHLGRFQACLENGDLTAARASWQEEDLPFILEDFAALLGESLDGARRVAGIVADLRLFASIDEEAEKEVELAERLRAVIRLLHGETPAGVTIAERFSPTPRLHCRPAYLSRAFHNLLQNALQAMRGRQGVVEVGLQYRIGFILVTFRDSGEGIPADHLPRIFDPFFTTRDVGQGMGLGLTVAREIVRAHGGEIRVESRAGKGSLFTMVLPLPKPAPPHA